MIIPIDNTPPPPPIDWDEAEESIPSQPGEEEVPVPQEE